MAVTTRRHHQAPTVTESELSIWSEPDAGTVGHSLRPLIVSLLGTDAPVRVELWDGSAFGPLDPIGTLVVRSPDALRRMLWAPGEIGLSRAYVAGDLDVEGELVGVLSALRAVPVRSSGTMARALPSIVRAARAVGALGRPLPPPPEEAHQRGRRHSKERDAQAISHHYDVGNEFYELVLGPSMTYSCARFSRPEMTLAEAQADKHELICRKLGLHEPHLDHRVPRLLDVGCGWGSLAIHAATHHGAFVVGITISQEQAARARERVAEAGVADQVEIRLQDYRDLGGEKFDAISSVGMFEHVGKARTAEYFAVLRELLHPQGRLLNHAISSVQGSKLQRSSFTGRYVFPDGELLDVADVCAAMELAGFEVRDVESLREHYARTLREWVHNLESSWDRATEIVGDGRARVWRLYMAGSAVGFDDGGVNLHQVLGVLPDPGGTSAMPATRDEWHTG
ncbi:MAG: class I SAM-dependent methyltransferase [Acidimicrobiales bacterium]